MRSSSTLQLMNSTMSGWSALRITILAARRVFPPDLITPANASYPFMNETGPDAVPPPLSTSRDDLMDERFDPVPDPNLNSIPSVFANSRMDSIVSSTELMKHAEHCGFFSNPQLNQTGLLNAPCWCTSRCLRSAMNAWRLSSRTKYSMPPAQSSILDTTRPISWRTLFSRAGESSSPRKYLFATMLVACCDQDFGTSTPSCRKTLSPPFSFSITAARVSHSIASNGSTPLDENRSLQASPLGACGFGPSCVWAVCSAMFRSFLRDSVFGC